MTNDLPSNFRSTKVFAYIAMTLLAISGIGHILSSVIAVGQIFSPDSVVHIDDTRQFSFWLLIQVRIDGINALVYILTAIFFLIWLNRAYKNLNDLKPDHLEFSSGWAVGWWFIPFLSLYKPFQVVREVWWESDPERDDEHKFLTASLHAAPTYMGFWWAAFLLMNFLANVESIVFQETKGNLVDMVMTSGYFLLISGIVTAIAAGLAIYLVNDITRRQEQRYLKLAREYFNFPQHTLT